MACGTPVVTANTTSLPEIVGDAAVTVDPNDPDGIAGALAMVLSSDDLRQDLIAKGRARAAGFAWDTTARETRAIYDRIVMEHGG
jgi:alpha-1,3-rhamnosyl/mannosyltransferase